MAFARSSIRAKKTHGIDKDKEALIRGPTPSISEPLSWFSHTDKNRNGTISPEEVCQSLYALLSPKSSQERLFIRKDIQKAWIKFDKNNDMAVSKNEFLQCGMIEYIVNFEQTWNKQPELKFSKKTKAPCSGNPPSLSEAQKWFEYVDTSNDQVLSADEIIHGLTLTLKPSTSSEKVAIRDIVERSFHVFDIDGNGEIEKWEFLMKGGMVDALIRLESEWMKCSTDDRTVEHMSKVVMKAPLRYTDKSPPPLSDASAWFDHYDIDGSKFLSQKEIVNALYVAFNAVTTDRQVTIRELVVSTWKTFDKDNSGNIDRNEFVSSNGLAKSYDNYFTKIWPKDASNNNPILSEKSKSIEIKIHVPKGRKAGDIVKVSSPRTHELVLLLIPEKTEWKRGKSGTSKKAKGEISTTPDVLIGRQRRHRKICSSSEIIIAPIVGVTLSWSDCDNDQSTLNLNHHFSAKKEINSWKN